MANKVQISESKLNRLIQESVYEVLMEAQEDEGLGKFLGNAYQWARNKANGFKRDFNAGRNNQRWKFKDYDEFASYGDNADNLRNFGPDTFANYRYHTVADRNNNARQTYTTQTGTEVGAGRDNHGRIDRAQPTQPTQTTQPEQSQDTSSVSPSPMPETQPTTAQPSAQPTTTQPKAKGPSQKQKKNWAAKGKKQQYRQSQQQGVNSQKQEAGKYLFDKGFRLVNGQWLYTKDGSNWPALKSEYGDIVQAAQTYANSNSQLGAMRESKNMNALISEAVRKAIMEEMKK